MKPLEIPDTSWVLSYRKHYVIDDMNLYAFGCGAAYTARASARIGELMLDRGVWNRQTLTKPEWIDIILAHHTEKTDIISENHGWRLNIKNRWPSLPADAFAGIGSGHKITLVIPDLDMVVVRYGKSFHNNGSIYQDDIFTTALDEKLFRPLVDSIIGPSSRMAQ